MLDHREALDKIAACRDQYSIVQAQRMYDDLAEKLKALQRNEDACDVLYVKAVHLFYHRLLVQALQVLADNRAFFNEYANYYLLLCARSATIIILDLLGYKKNFFAMMEEVYELARLHKVSTCITSSLNNMAYYYSRQQKYDEAARYLEECLLVYDEYEFFDDDTSKLTVIHHLAEVSLGRGDDERFFQCLQMHDEYPKQRDPKTEQSYLLLRLRAAMQYEQFDEAREYAQLILSQPLEQYEDPEILTMLEQTVRLYEQLEDIDAAIHALERLHAYRDQLSARNIQQQSILCQYMLEEAQLLEQLKIDALTGVYNRTSFMQFVEQKLSQPHNDAWKLLAILDIDYFKQINDTYGHVVGDEMLKEISRRAVQMEKAPNGLQVAQFGRYGGDEFYVYLQARTFEQLEKATHIFYRSLREQPFIYEDCTCNISISCGGVYTNATQLSVTSWLEQANALLYEMKESGRGRLALAPLTI